MDTWRRHSHHCTSLPLSAGRLAALGMRGFLYRPATAGGHRWADLARPRMRLDYLRITAPDEYILDVEYPQLVREYHRAGLAHERCLTRLGHGRWLLCRDRARDAASVNAVMLDVAEGHGLCLLTAAAWDLAAAAAARLGDQNNQITASQTAMQLRVSCGARGPARSSVLVCSAQLAANELFARR